MLRPLKGSHVHLKVRFERTLAEDFVIDFDKSLGTSLSLYDNVLDKDLFHFIYAHCFTIVIIKMAHISVATLLIKCILKTSTDFFK